MPNQFQVPAPIHSVFIQLVLDTSGDSDTKQFAGRLLARGVAELEASGRLLIPIMQTSFKRKELKKVYYTKTDDLSEAIRRVTTKAIVSSDRAAVREGLLHYCVLASLIEVRNEKLVIVTAR